VVVVGVNFQDAAGDARQYAATSGGSYPVVSDSDSSAALAYGIRGVPETYVVDPKGQLVDRFVGPVTYPQLSRRIDDVMSKGDR
jgi:cytochrome c biogenesis protein CcmG/thiol:disulfide interchange protein DsbE